MPDLRYETRITRLSVGLADKELYAPAVTHVEIDDEGGGEFIVLRQHPDDKDGEQTIRIDPEEWPAVAKAVARLMKEMR